MSSTPKTRTKPQPAILPSFTAPAVTARLFTRWVAEVIATKPVFKTKDRLHLNLIAGAAGELGEVLDILKKFLVDESGTATLDRVHLSEEFGDALYYIVLLAQEFDVPLADVFSRAIVKLGTRFPNGFNWQDFKARVDKNVSPDVLDRMAFDIRAKAQEETFLEACVLHGRKAEAPIEASVIRTPKRVRHLVNLTRLGVAARMGCSVVLVERLERDPSLFHDAPKYMDPTWLDVYAKALGLEVIDRGDRTNKPAVLKFPDGSIVCMQVR